jgi:hypothetical protein
MAGYWVKTIRFAACLSALSTAVNIPAANASDTIFMLTVSDALANPDAARLDSSIKYYFGNSPHPGVQKSFGEFVTNQKSNGFGKRDSRACSWVLLSALLEFEKRAKAEGANAVVNIRSYYKKHEVSNDTQVECHSGFLIVGIALKGEFVKLKTN